MSGTTAPHTRGFFFVEGRVSLDLRCRDPLEAKSFVRGDAVLMSMLFVGQPTRETCRSVRYSGSPHTRFLFFEGGVSLRILGVGIPSKPNPSSGAMRV